MTNALGFECVKVALKQDRLGFILTLSVHPDEIPEELMRDFVGARYMCALARLNSDESAIPYDNRVKKSAILCKTTMFHNWLKDIGVITDIHEESIYEPRAIEFIYETCSIESRTELNGNTKARKHFDEMVAEYERWKTEQEPF
jgi:hypothetical protein